MSNDKASNIFKFNAYARIKAVNAGDFVPTTVFLSRQGSDDDWKKSLELKASMVYHAITREPKPKTETAQEDAKTLLDTIAKQIQTLTAEDDTARKYSPDLIKDGIFLVVFLSELHEIKADPSTENQQILKDIIKVENQLCLKLISHVAKHVESAIKTKDVTDLLEKFKGRKLSFPNEQFVDAIHGFCQYYSPFKGNDKRLGPDMLEKENLLHCLHDSLVKAGVSDGYENGKVSRCPSARQLKRSGVRFEASSEATIHVQFSKPMLEMPALVYDFKLETVVRNLMAWECWRADDQKPVTRYFRLIKELATDLSDVQLMEKSGLIKWPGKDLQEVLDLIKRINSSVYHPYAYKDLDKVIGRVSEYHEERMKKFFVRNRVAVIWVSSVAAASVIGTAIYAAKKRRG